MSDEEPVDTMPAIREAAKPNCVSDFGKYEACIARIEARKEGTCEPQYMEWLKCIDKYSVKAVMKSLK